MTLIKDDDRPGQGKAFQEGPDLRRLTVCGMTPSVIRVIRVIWFIFSYLVIGLRQPLRTVTNGASL
jgi:hypothetical protein